MTHPTTDFKYWLTIVALPLLFIGLAYSVSDTSNSEYHSTDQTVQIQQTLKEFQHQTLVIQQYALEIESQIDEVRRASPKEETEELSKLKAQFTELKKQHTLLEEHMQTLRKTLTVSNDNLSLPSSAP